MPPGRLSQSTVICEAIQDSPGALICGKKALDPELLPRNVERDAQSHKCRKQAKSRVFPSVMYGQKRRRGIIQIELAPAVGHVWIAEQLIEETLQIFI